MKRGRRRRWVRRIVVGVVAATLTAAGLGWVGLRHIPDWYKPVLVPRDQLQRVRDSLTDKFREISDRMVARAAFEVYFTDQMVTEWVVARGEIWPDSQQWLPDWLTDPVVAFTPDGVVLGAHLARNGWESIIGARFSTRVEGDVLVLRLERVTAGAVPAPLSALSKPLERMVNSGRLDVEAMPDELAQAIRKLRQDQALDFLTRGHRLRGPFIWKNGDRPYRIRNIQLGDGWLKALIEPL